MLFLQTVLEMNNTKGQKIISYFKDRWGITSTWQFIIINLVFAASGFSILFTKPYIYEWLSLPTEANFWTELLFFVVVVLPLYNVYFFIWSILLGQYKFFVFYQKKIFSRFSKIGNLFRVKQNT